MLGSETMPTGNEKESPLKDFLKEYSDAYKKIREEVEGMTKEKTRNKLDEFLKKNKSLTSKNPKLKSKLLTNEEGLKDFLTLGFAQEKLKPIREKILKNIEKEMKGKNAEEQHKILKKRFLEISLNKEINTDIQLLNDLMRRILITETKAISDKYRDPKKEKIINAGKEWIENGGEKPNELKNVIVPQHMAMASFRLALQFQPEYEEIRNTIGSGMVRNVQEFSDITYGLYKAFLKENGFDKSKFGHSEEWYKKLCISVGITDNAFSSLDLSQILKGEDHLEVQKNIQKKKEEAEKKADHFRKEKESYMAEAQVLREAAEDMKKDGDYKEAEQAIAQAEELEKKGKESNKKEKYFRDIVTAVTGIQDEYSKAKRNAAAEMALFPGHPNVRYLGALGAPFTWASQAMSLVGRYAPDPGSLYDMDVGKILFGGVKVAALSAVAINFLKIGVGGYNVLSKFKGFIPIPGTFHPIEASKEIFKGMVKMIFSKGTISTGATALLAAGVVNIDSPKSAERWIRGNKTVDKTLNWAGENIPYYLGKGARSLKKWVWDFAVVGGASGIWKYGKKAWNAIANRFGVESKMIDEYREFFATMKLVKKQASIELSQRNDLKALALSTGTLKVSTKSLKEFAIKYIEATSGRKSSDDIVPVSLIDLAEMGFLYRNGVRVTKESLEEDDAYKKLSSDQKNISISETLSAKIISQKAFIDRNRIRPSS